MVPEGDITLILFVSRLSMAREERFLKVPAGMWEMLFRLIDSWVRLEFGDTVIVIVIVIPQLYSRLQYSIICILEYCRSRKIFVYLQLFFFGVVHILQFPGKKH